MRATIDLDDPAVEDVRRAWDRLSDHGDGRVLGRVSSSGTGVHLKVHGCDPEEAAALRVLCGDDSKRRRFDAESSLKPKQILFTAKHGRPSGEWTPELDELIEEYLDRAPVGYRRRLLKLRYPVLREVIV